MEEEKKAVWRITSFRKVCEKVAFSEPVSAAEAKRLYLDGREDDVLDFEFISLEKMVSIR